MSCRCQGCGREYLIDLRVRDEVWERIKPQGEPFGGGLLCGTCIVNRLEAVGEYGVPEQILEADPYIDILENRLSDYRRRIKDLLESVEPRTPGVEYEDWPELDALEQLVAWRRS